MFDTLVLAIRDVFGLSKVKMVDVDEEYRKHVGNPGIKSVRLLESIVNIKLDMVKTETDINWIKKMLWLIIAIELAKVGLKG